MTDPLNSKNLVPFKKRRSPYDIPGMTGENEERLIDQVDHDLSAEERRFIRHYMNYADTLLNRAADADPVLEESVSAMPEGSRATELPEQKNETEQKSATDEAA